MLAVEVAERERSRLWTRWRMCGIQGFMARLRQKLGVVRQAETIDPRRNFHSLWPHVRLTFSGTSNYISDTPDEVSCKVIAKLAV